MAFQPRYSAFKKQLGDLLRCFKQEPPRCIVLYGEDDFLLYKAEQSLKTRFSSLGYESLQIAEARTRELPDLLLESGLFVEKTLYILNFSKKNAQAIPILAQLDLKQIEHTLLVVWPFKTLPKPWSKFVKDTESAVLNCIPPYPSELGQVCKDLFKKYQLQAEPAAERLLLGQAGHDLFQLENEIRFFSLLSTDSSSVLTAETVGQHSGLLPEQEVFKLEKMLLARSKQAYGLLSELLLRGVSGLLLLGIISKYCQQGLKYLELSKQALPLKEQASLLGLPFYIVQEYNKQKKNLVPERLREALYRAALSDIRMKSTRVDSEWELQGILSALI